MSITVQRTVGGNSPSGTSHTLSVQVDSGTDRGLLVCIAVDSLTGSFDVSGSVTRDGQTLTQVGAGMVLTNLGAVRFYYVPAPNTGTANVTWSTSGSVESRAVAYVLDGVHQSTAPTYVNGTNGTTISYAHTGLTIGAIVIAAAKRGGTVGWTGGGGLTIDNTGFYGASTGDTLAVGSLIADATNETPTLTLSGGVSGTNVYGSIAWSPAPAPSGPAFRSYYITG